MRGTVVVAVWALMTNSLWADWKVLPPIEHRDASGPPGSTPAEAKPIKVGDKWPEENKFRWIIGELAIPETIDKKPVAGEPVGMRINGGDGGEIYVDGRLQARFDNDHPALVLVSEKATPGRAVRIAIQMYGKVQGGDSFSEANWVSIERKRAVTPLELSVNPKKTLCDVPDGIVGLSQGGGLADYEDATAAKLKAGGFKWFRMDNVFTNVLKKGDSDKPVYDWTDFDRRVDFIVGQMGVDAIMAVSYMPQVLDAVPDPERHSAPKDFGAWEELCFQAAKRCVERGRRVAFWEVWNEVNTGWLKPGPEDIGAEAYKKLYTQALGREQTEHDVNRRFEAYCKLYRATARGVLRGDPKTKVGGPALASGPMENQDCGHCFHGKGFARGLMLWCRQEKLPLDFVSWHEYFQAPDVFAKEADLFREYLREFPELEKSVKSLMVTEWNQAWWADRPQDHEVGAAWCANTITRAFIPKKIDRPCFFYVKQNDANFRGDYSLLMPGNVPKAQYNVAKIFNDLRGQWVEVTGGDDDVSAVAAWDEHGERLAVVLVNFRDRYGLGRRAHLKIEALPKQLHGGQWRQWTVDATHCNVWNDAQKAELAVCESGKIVAGRFEIDRELAANSVTLVELAPAFAGK